MHLCARPGRVDAVELADEVGGAPGAFSPYAVYLPGGAPGDLAAIRDGRAHVQDEGSQLVAAALAAAPVEGEDTRWLDLCAGPGGKAGLLGALAAQRGAARDRGRGRRAPGPAGRAGHRRPAGRRCCTTDGRTSAATRTCPRSGFDRVLVDAPCTGLGSLRRRPEARWRRTARPTCRR